MCVTVTGRSFSTCEVYVASAAYPDSRAGYVGKFVEMAVNGVGTEGNAVYVASSAGKSLAGYGSKTVAVVVAAASGNDGAS